MDVVFNKVDQIKNVSKTSILILINTLLLYVMNTGISSYPFLNAQWHNPR